MPSANAFVGETVAVMVATGLFALPVVVHEVVHDDSKKGSAEQKETQPINQSSTTEHAQLEQTTEATP